VITADVGLDETAALGFGYIAKRSTNSSNKEFLMDQRREPRGSYFSRVQLFFCNESGVDVEIPAMIEDRSQSGFGIRAGKPVQPGCAVRIQQQSRRYSGVVRRCSISGSEYFLGIELKSDPDEV
jgi:hypothetical protein